ncbi:MAG: histone deacetylase, partial [Candidatus Hydrogenedentes bacterium]|nr:histone deacetylase [Candidatus Hydrogenedentota bacterium]
YLREVRGLGRVAIVDWDVHHGNGTQDAFYDDPTVFYASIHQIPHFPGSGHDWETGKNEAKGTILNVPVPPGTTNDEFVGAVSDTIVPAVREFAPEFLLVSAGFDAHESDMLSSQHVSTRGYADITKLLMDCARDCCHGRLVSVLEGGYNLSSLADAVEAHVRTMINGDSEDE